MMSIFKKSNQNEHEEKPEILFDTSKEREELEELKSIQTKNPFKKARIKKDIKDLEKIIEKKHKEKIKYEDKLEKRRYQKIAAIVGGSCLAVLAICSLIGEELEKVRSIDFAEKNEIVYVGDTIDFSYKVGPDRASYKDDEITLQVEDDGCVIEVSKLSYKAEKEGVVSASLIYDERTFDSINITVLPVKAEKLVADDISVGLNMQVEPEITFYPENTTYKEYSLQSDNPEIVKIDNRKLVGVSEGFTTITAKSKDGVSTEFKAETVRIHPDNIEFSNIKNTYVRGQSYNLLVKYTPEEISVYECVWSSSNKNVATINDQGLLEAKTAGKTTIVAKYNEDVLCSKEIEVINPLADSIKINSGYNSIYVGNTLKLSYTFTPSPVRNTSVKWSSSDEKVATIDENGVLTAVSVGTVVIKAATDNNVSDEYEISTIAKQVQRSNVERTNTNNSSSYSYLANTSTKKFHKLDCKDILKMNKSNKWYTNKSREELISEGYDPCGHCHP